MTIETEVAGRLLLVSEANLPRIVALVAPHLVLVDRAQFTDVAVTMLALVEAVAGGG